MGNGRGIGGRGCVVLCVVLCVEMCVLLCWIMHSERRNPRQSSGVHSMKKIHISCKKSLVHNDQQHCWRPITAYFALTTTVGKGHWMCLGTCFQCLNVLFYLTRDYPRSFRPLRKLNQSKGWLFLAELGNTYFCPFSDFHGWPLEASQNRSWASDSTGGFFWVVVGSKELPGAHRSVPQSPPL